MLPRFLAGVRLLLCSWAKMVEVFGWRLRWACCPPSLAKGSKKQLSISYVRIQVIRCFIDLSVNVSLAREVMVGVRGRSSGLMGFGL